MDYAEMTTDQLGHLLEYYTKQEIQLRKELDTTMSKPIRTWYFYKIGWVQNQTIQIRTALLKRATDLRGFLLNEAMNEEISRGLVSDRKRMFQEASRVELAEIEQILQQQTQNATA